MKSNKSSQKTKHKGNNIHVNRYSIIGFFLFFLLIGIIGYLTYNKNLWIDDKLINLRKNKTVKKHTSVKTTASSSNNNGNVIPSYDEYINLSITNHWYPIDPVEKLMSTISKYSQIIDVIKPKSDNDINRYTSLMAQEINYILTIITRDNSTKHSVIDLTSSFQQSIEIVSTIIYQQLKMYLSENSLSQKVVLEHQLQQQQYLSGAQSLSYTGVMITRTEVMQNTAHWMYTPIKELVKVALRKYPHIKIDVTGVNSPLIMSVRNKLYGLLSVLMILAADTLPQAIHIAVSQGDDIAVGILLKQPKHIHQCEESVVNIMNSNVDINVDLNQTNKDDCINTFMINIIKDNIILAKKLSFFNIEKRLQFAYDSLCCNNHLDNSTTTTKNYNYSDSCSTTNNNISNNHNNNNNNISNNDTTNNNKVTVRGEIDTAVIPIAQEYLPWKDITESPLTTMWTITTTDPLITNTITTVISDINNTNTTTTSDVVNEGDQRSLILFNYIDYQEDDDKEESYIPNVIDKDNSSRLVHNNIRLGRCLIDRMDISNLTTELFLNEYVYLNKPLLITYQNAQTNADVVHDANSNHQKGDIWSIENLTKNYGQIKVIASYIPYGTLFGKKEVITTLSDFVTHPNYGMIPYMNSLVSILLRQRCNGKNTQVVEDVLSNDCCDYSCNILKNNMSNTIDLNSTFLFKAIKDLPLYIFSGRNQEINQIMRKHMIKVINSISSININNNTNSNNTVIDLLHSIHNNVYNNSSAINNNNNSNRKKFNEAWLSQFFLGSILSGAPFHHHSYAFNFLIYGRKQWTLLPPSNDIYSNIHPFLWIKHKSILSNAYPYNKQYHHQNKIDKIIQKPCIYIQEKNEIFFIPRHFTHQVLNLAETIGFAIEIEK